jgi:hypothetical protein
LINQSLFRIAQPARRKKSDEVSNFEQPAAWRVACQFGKTSPICRRQIASGNLAIFAPCEAGPEDRPATRFF